jgi:hypothetical protein
LRVALQQHGLINQWGKHEALMLASDSASILDQIFARAEIPLMGGNPKLSRPSEIVVPTAVRECTHGACMHGTGSVAFETRTGRK